MAAALEIGRRDGWQRTSAEDRKDVGMDQEAVEVITMLCYAMLVGYNHHNIS